MLTLNIEDSRKLKNAGSLWKLEKAGNTLSLKASVKEYTLADTLILASEPHFEFMVIGSAATGNTYIW